MVSVADKGFTFVLNKWNETSGFSTCLCGLRLYVTHSLAALLLFKALILVFRALELSVSRKLPSLQALCAWIWAVYPVLPLRCKHRSHFKYLWAATFRFLHRWWSLWFVWATYRLPLKPLLQAYGSLFKSEPSSQFQAWALCSRFLCLATFMLALLLVTPRRCRCALLYRWFTAGQLTRCLQSCTNNSVFCLVLLTCQKPLEVASM